SHATAGRAVYRGRSRRPISRGFAAFLLYALICVGWYGHNVLPHFAGRWCLGRCATDTNYYAWSLQWMSYALAHGLNPFHTNVLAAPGSVDLTWVVTIPGPALILTPLTGLFGPVASNNVLLLAGPPLAAWAAYLVCNQVTRRFWPSVVGGLVFGYSPYVGRFMFAQLHTLLVFPTALAVYLVLRRIDGSLGKRAFLALFSLALFGELFISVEVFASMTLFGAIALLGVFAFEPGRLRRAVLSVARLIAAAYLIVAVVASPYLIELFRNRPSGSIRDPSKTSIDLIRFLVPQRGAWVGGRRWFDGI